MLDALVIDLDGTIVDCSARHYACYADLARDLGLQVLGPQAYWSLKRARAPWAEILSSRGSDTDPTRFAERFAERIELPRYLALDRLYPGALDALRAMRAMTRLLLLVTMRRNQRQLAIELDRLGVAPLFDRVLARGADGAQDKGEMAAPFLSAGTRRAAWIGDTEEDIAGARKTGAFACAVCCGLRERRLLESEQPDSIAADLGAVAALLRSSSASRGVRA
jgi:phosphoglycolate phosphatase